jgi:nicotinate-nucleotide adenylyltransferase
MTEDPRRRNAMGEKTALFGGSFDPIHLGHLILARSVAEQLGLDRVIFLPSATPPHKEASELTPAVHRAAMVRLAVDGEPLFDVSDYDLTRDGPTYTVQTVAYFQEQLGSATVLHWIIGSDSLAELASWYQVGELVERCRVITAARPGWEKPDLAVLHRLIGDARLAKVESGILKTPRIDISSTVIRARVRAGRSIRYLVPEPVRAYIREQQLYRSE